MNQKLARIIAVFNESLNRVGSPPLLTVSPQDSKRYIELFGELSGATTLFGHTKLNKSEQFTATLFYLVLTDEAVGYSADPAAKLKKQIPKLIEKLKTLYKAIAGDSKTFSSVVSEEVSKHPFLAQRMLSANSIFARNQIYFDTAACHEFLALNPAYLEMHTFSGFEGISNFVNYCAISKARKAAIEEHISKATLHFIVGETQPKLTDLQNVLNYYYPVPTAFNVFFDKCTLEDLIILCRQPGIADVPYLGTVLHAKLQAEQAIQGGLPKAVLERVFSITHIFSLAPKVLNCIWPSLIALQPDAQKALFQAMPENELFGLAMNPIFVANASVEMWGNLICSHDCIWQALCGTLPLEDTLRGKTSMTEQLSATKIRGIAQWLSQNASITVYNNFTSVPAVKEIISRQTDRNDLSLFTLEAFISKQPSANVKGSGGVEVDNELAWVDSVAMIPDNRRKRK